MEGKAVHFDLTDLRLFVHIAEMENLTKGAQKAYLSPAAASARLKMLEQQLDSRLFYRDSRGVTLTQAGETLLRHARLILRQVEHVKSEFAANGADTAGHIRIYANTTAVTEFMPEVLGRFLAERPEVTVDLQERLTRDIVRSVVDGSTDLGIVSGPVPMQGLQALHFSTDRLVLVTQKGHPLSQRKKIVFADVLNYQHISMHEGSTLHAFLLELSAQHGHTLTLRIQVRSFEAMCRMIEAGVGIGILPESAAIRHRKTMKLAVIQIDEEWALRERSVLVRDMDALPGCAKALVAELMASGSGGSNAAD
ncbi:LysR family transcriptional regulator [Pseudogulbenkiania subflava]|uniref:DNA-binding transcriptional regulator, LysR family n=1 Tax=Pseudogulbenkiania subflava DSM 22618 TaxID=1123014 RepID=A0A1Y6BSU0_9NEIS|nr:LysR family transcriptional regulator [Pseudogulbenkiania subflava]SMF26623.1 DNA-binding transcriptional regulator, LysR family [Pseudogulbenkiania subflava DSM 22618]